MVRLAIVAIIAALVGSVVSVKFGVHAGEQTVIDDFDDNALATEWSEFAHGTGVTLAETNQRLEVHFAADAMNDPQVPSFISGITHDCALIGDFSVVVDFELPIWPGANGVRIGIQATPWTVLRYADFANSSYATDFPGQLTNVPTFDTSGKLRLSRDGSIFTGSYWNGANWADIASIAGTTDDVPLVVQAWSGDAVFADQEVKVAFDNLVLDSGSQPCIASPTPSPTPTSSLSPTVQPSDTSTPVPSGSSVVWGDNNCSTMVDPVDSLFVLRGDAGLPTNTGQCPDMGGDIEIVNASPHTWGDVDCSGSMTPVDSLKVLRFDAGLSAAQEQGCPGFGTNVTVVEA